jgi:predicted ATP-dependent endonuclease of OLD family
MDSFNEIHYLYYLCLLGLQKKIIARFENKFSNLRFSKEKLKKVNEIIDDFCWKNHELSHDNKNIIMNEFYSLLKPMGDKIENFLEASKDKDNFELSPGEKLIILSNFWLINAEYFKYNPPHIENAYNKNKILLLDEADAHMHPRLIRDFMNILKNGDIHYLGFQVFMTTHNPITVTFTPKDN